MGEAGKRSGGDALDRLRVEQNAKSGPQKAQGIGSLVLVARAGDTCPHPV